MTFQEHIQNVPALGRYFPITLVLFFLFLNGVVLIEHRGEFDQMTLLVHLAIILNVSVASFWIGKIRNKLIQGLLIFMVISINQFCVSSILITSDRFYEPYPKAIY